MSEGQEAASRAMAAPPPCPLLGDGVTDDTLVNIARFLPVEDLLSLQLTCPRFAAKCIPAPGVGGEDAAAAAPEMLSIPEEAARLWVAGCSEQERGWVPRLEYESWLGLMREVEVLRLPLAFGRAHGNITLTEGGAVATNGATDYSWCAAASTVGMRSRLHYAQYTVLQGGIYFGVIRAGWVEGWGNARFVDGHCFYNTASGHRARRYPGYYPNWEGAQTANRGDRIGMLLDLEQGSMTVWKNDEKLGVMQAEGLRDPFCWAVTLFQQGDSARIQSARAPASPTEEQLATAKAWQRRRGLYLPPTATDAECEAAEGWTV